MCTLSGEATLPFLAIFIFASFLHWSLLRTSDSCNVNLPIKVVKDELLVYFKISTEMFSSELPIIGTKTIFRLLKTQTEIFGVKSKFL